MNGNFRDFPVVKARHQLKIKNLLNKVDLDLKRHSDSGHVCILCK